MTKINKDLRLELKSLSDSSTMLCDEIQKKHYKRKKTPKPVDESFQLQVKDRELVNSDKQMKNLINDYNMVKKRVEKVSDFNYAVELKNRLAETTQEVRQNDKQIKELEQEQRKKDIEMNRLMKDP